MKMMIVIDMNATLNKVVYHSIIKNNDCIMFKVEDFFEQAEIKVDEVYVEMISEDLHNGDTFNYRNFHFEMIEL